MCENSQYPGDLTLRRLSYLSWLQQESRRFGLSGNLDDILDDADTWLGSIRESLGNAKASPEEALRFFQIAKEDLAAFLTEIRIAFLICGCFIEAPQLEALAVTGEEFLRVAIEHASARQRGEE